MLHKGTLYYSPGSLLLDSLSPIEQVSNPYQPLYSFAFRKTKICQYSKSYETKLIGWYTYWVVFYKPGVVMPPNFYYAEICSYSLPIITLTYTIIYKGLDMHDFWESHKKVYLVS